MQPLAGADAAHANVLSAQNLLPDQRHHDRMIYVMVGCIRGRYVLKSEPRDKADDAGKARLEHSIGPLVHLSKLADKGFNNDLRGIEHREATWLCGFFASSTERLWQLGDLIQWDRNRTLGPTSPARSVGLKLFPRSR